MEAHSGQLLVLQGCACVGSDPLSPADHTRHYSLDDP